MVVKSAQRDCFFQTYFAESVAQYGCESVDGGANIITGILNDEETNTE